jgi:hypothetical protein
MNNAQSLTRSFVIPVLDFSPHSPYNIRTLLDDLKEIPGEVICIFNSREVFEALSNHPRINKYSFNNLNAGVSRSWNLGLNLAEGRTVFIVNADMRIGRLAVEQMEYYLMTLDQAAMVGPQGGVVDYRDLPCTGNVFNPMAWPLTFVTAPVFLKNGTLACRSCSPAWPAMWSR